MQKNFVQRHALFFSVIVFCFVIVPFIRNAYAQEKEDKKQQAETMIIRTQKQVEEKKVTKRRVVLDAGHGGYDDGSAAADGTKEKTITLQLTKKIGKLLEKQDVEVVYTRLQDKVSWPADNEKDLLERSPDCQHIQRRLFCIHSYELCGYCTGLGKRYGNLGERA